MDLDALRQDYNRSRDWLQDEVLRCLQRLLIDVRGKFKEKYPNIAEPKFPEARVKLFAKIIGKLQQKNRVWDYDKIFIPVLENKVQTIVNDLIGGKLVCATPGDVMLLVEIFKGWTNRLSIIEGEPKYNPETGYRAYHIDGYINVAKDEGHILFPVEIQIKTLLQDAWGNFDHDELYKPTDEVPEVTKAISLQVAHVLAALDQIGQVIRDEKFKKLPAPSDIGQDETLVTPRTLNYLVDKIFQVTLSEVELQKSVNQLRAFGYDSIAQVDDLARDSKLENIIGVAKVKLRLSGAPTPFEILYFGPLAAKEEEASVLSELRRMYSFTELSCSGCQAPITEEEKEFREKLTDLDQICYCKECRKIKLKKCLSCEKFTESEVCKDCRAKDTASEIV